MKIYRKLVFLFIAFSQMLLLFQNCGQKTLSFSKNTVSEKFGDISCLTFSDGTIDESCKDSNAGLIGKLYYMLDKTSGVEKPEYVYDKYDNKLKFDGDTLVSVNVLIQRGYTSDTYVLMPDVSVPAVAFSTGFEVTEGKFLNDHTGKKLIEAFALDLKGKLRLAPHLSEGDYEIGVLSDDGSILGLDMNGDGAVENVIEHDGYHSPGLKCATIKIPLTRNSAIPMRLRYYQGPRATIALTVVMRKLNSGDVPGQDVGCGYTDHENDTWFTGISTDLGYVPNYVTSRFGALLGRGWFIPPKEMYGLPDSL